MIDAIGWSQIGVPMLVVTGTTDVLPGFTDDWHLHLISYRAVRPGLGYALTFDGMNHYFNGAFGRPTPAGAASAGQVATLNRLVERFIDASAASHAPTDASWRALSAPGLTAEAR
jgi:hypothetical protein